MPEKEWCQNCEVLREEIRILREHAEDLMKEKQYWREKAEGKESQPCAAETTQR